MQQVFTTNWEIYRVCLSATDESKQLFVDTQELNPLELSTRDRCRFEETLSDAIDEELSSLGDSVKKAIYHHVRKTMNIKKQEIPRKVDQFADAIEQIFGAGAKFIEIGIMRRLHEKIDQDVEYFLESDDLVFTEYVRALRHSGHKC